MFKALTVCIPTYGRPALAARCAQSILSQSKLPLEIIISANSGEDYSALSRLLLSSSNVVRIVGGSTLSGIDNFIRCVAAAAGNMVFLMADDMYLETASSLEAALGYMQSCEESMIVSPSAKIRTGSISMPCTRYLCDSQYGDERILQYAKSLKSDNTVLYSIYPTNLLLQVLMEQKQNGSLYGKSWTSCGDWLGFSTALLHVRNVIIDDFKLVRDETDYSGKTKTTRSTYCTSFQEKYHIQAVACGFFAYFMRWSSNHNLLSPKQRFQLGKASALGVLANNNLPSSMQYLANCLAACYEEGGFFKELWSHNPTDPGK